VERAAGGDVDALAEIVETHHDDMARIAYLITRDGDLAQDAVQAAWPVAWRKLGALRESESFRSIALPSDADNVLAAAAVPDGRALLVGVRAGSGDRGEPWALLLDPFSGATEVLPPPDVDPVEEWHPDDRPSATTLADGRILVVGLHGEGESHSADIFHPATGSFSAAPVGPVRPGTVVTVLADGDVLIAGGIVEDGSRAEYVASADAVLWQP
jgi:hypothetical protein